MCSTCPEQPGCCSSAQHHFSKFHFYLQESREPQESSWRLKPLKELQGSELLHSEDGNAQLLKKNILKAHNCLRKGIKMDFTAWMQCTLLITTSSTDTNVLWNSVPIWVGSSHPLVQKMQRKGDTMSNITLLISCISRYFHFLCRHKWGTLLRALKICPEPVWQILGFEGFPGTRKALGLHWKP